mgnify:CR=1 FL=1
MDGSWNLSRLGRLVNFLQLFMLDVQGRIDGYSN